MHSTNAPGQPSGSKLRARAYALVRGITGPRAVTSYLAPLMGVVRRRRNTPGEERILVIKLDDVGDLVLASPFLRELRAARPRAQVTLVVKGGVGDLVDPCPYVDEIITFDPYRSERWWQDLVRLGRSLRFAATHLWGRFDIAIVPRWGRDFYGSLMLGWLSGAPERVGFATSASATAPPGAADRLLTTPVFEPDPRHEVEQNLRLLGPLGADGVDAGGIEVWLQSDDEYAADRLWPKTTDPVVAIAPGAGLARRMWPADRYAAVAGWLVDSGIHVVVLGGPGEEALGDRIARTGDSVSNLVGQTTLRQTAALLGRCMLLIGNDAGPVHLAAAVGTPAVCISCHPMGGDDAHENSPLRFRPWGVENVVIRPHHPADGCTGGCMSDDPHCILAIAPEEVISAAGSWVTSEKSDDKRARHHAV